MNYLNFKIRVMIYNKQALKNLFERDLIRIESELKTEISPEAINRLNETKELRIKSIEKLNQI